MILITLQCLNQNHYWENRQKTSSIDWLNRSNFAQWHISLRDYTEVCDPGHCCLWGSITLEFSVMTVMSILHEANLKKRQIR